MTIQVGDKIPSCTLKTMGEKGPEDISTEQIFSGKKVVFFAVPGAFTPGCSMTHLPGFVVNADKIKAAGVDTIVCMAVNDANGVAEFTKALDLVLDASGFGLGIRCQRFAMIVEDGVVSELFMEPEGGIDVSSAENVLKSL
jgi:peroxiredoxin